LSNPTDSSNSANFKGLASPLSRMPQDTRSRAISTLSEAEVRMFQASSAFVSACQEATVAMHALTAKIREMEKKVEPQRKLKVKA
jgi:hypothetical protein